MNIDIHNKIKDLLSNDTIISICNAEEFYFEKAKVAFDDFVNCEVSDEVKLYLLTNRKEYEELKQNFQDSQELFELGQFLFTLVSYCDAKAFNKNLLNKYPDKRVLALAFVRMNNWVEQLIAYKFGEAIPEGSVKNAIDYLLNPLDNFTMLSENHRQQISENLFNKDYKNSTFKDDFLEYFKDCNINVNNSKNYTHCLTRIVYFLESEWKESLVGIMASDSTGWLSNHQMKDLYDVFWNSKRPSGTDKTLKLLRECIAENGHFKLFYTSFYKVNFIAEVIDFVESEKEYNKAKWQLNFTDEANCPKYDKLQDNNKVAKITFLIDKFYEVDPIPIDQFKIYKSYSYPTQDNLTPIQEYISNTEKNKIDRMEANKKLLHYKKQIILQGPPGTGKTREAELIAKEMLNLSDVKYLEDNDQYKLVQFHPSYTYEDFVRGITAKPTEDGSGIIYEAENKTLGEFAKNALDNFLDSKGLLQNENFENRLQILVDEVNDQVINGKVFNFGNKSTAEIFAVGNDYFYYSFPTRKEIRYKLLFSDLKIIFKNRSELKIPIDLRDVEKDLQLVMKGKYPYYFMLLRKLESYKIKAESKDRQKLKEYILVIDEINRANLSSVLGELIYSLEYREKEVESMYEVDGSKKLILPPNLYIIGTMNTADRSVGHIDYAIRRRFAFVDVLPENLEPELKDDFKDDIFAKVASLFIKNYDSTIKYSDENVNIIKSEHMTGDFDPKDVWLGHSYFIQHYEKDENGEDLTEKPIDFRMRIRYEIKPILEEYIKDGILKESARETINTL